MPGPRKIHVKKNPQAQPAQQQAPVKIPAIPAAALGLSIIVFLLGQWTSLDPVRSAGIICIVVSVLWLGYEGMRQ